MVEQATKEQPQATQEASQPNVETTSSAERTEPSEKDWKSEHDKVLQEKESLAQKLRSAEGRLKSREPDGTAAIIAEIKAMRREERRERVERAELEPQEKQKRLEEITEEEQQETAAARFKNYATRIAGRMNRQLEREKVSLDHPKVAEILARWGRVRSEDDVDDVYESFDEVLAELSEERHKKEVETVLTKAQQEFQRKNRDDGVLGLGTPSGRGAGVTITSDNIDSEHIAGRYPDDKYRHFLRTKEIT